MNKLAITIAALSLSAGAAFAENPNVSRTDTAQPAVDQTVTSSIGKEASSASAPILGNHFDGDYNGRVLNGR
ncbi:MAG: hypothetical protein QHC90_23960 [Shinella sp.]|nr:hypothetical protein [Shinella sp.]